VREFRSANYTIGFLFLYVTSKELEMAELRPNKIKHKLRNGDVVTVAQSVVTPDMVEIFSQFGFDGIWIEAEHGPVDFGDIADFSRACDLWGLTSVVRVNLNLPGVIYRTLDLGAQAVVVPHVNTAEEARAVVDATKFHPLGSRGMTTSRQGIGVKDYYLKANDETMAIVLIEDIVAVQNLAEILAVDNIDVFFVTTGDLSQSMGYIGQHTHPKVVATVDRAVDQIVAAGRTAGVIGSESNIDRYVGMGARFFTTHWLEWVAAGSRAYHEKIAAKIKEG